MIPPLKIRDRTQKLTENLNFFKKFSLERIEVFFLKEKTMRLSEATETRREGFGNSRLNSEQPGELRA